MSICPSLLARRPSLILSVSSELEPTPAHGCRSFVLSLPRPPVAAAPAPAVQPEGPCITAPLVGTFYAASAPDAAPFVQVGDKVKKGQTVCLMEAMKMMNEVHVPCDCTIEAILQEDGALVSFGDPLIRYREG